MTASVTVHHADLGIDRVLRRGAEVGRLPDLAGQRPPGGSSGAATRMRIASGARDSESSAVAFTCVARHGERHATETHPRAPWPPTLDKRPARRFASPMKSATKRVAGRG